MFNVIINHPLFGRLLATLVCTLLVSTLYFLATKLIKRKSNWTMDNQRKVAVTVRNTLIVAFSTAMFFIWLGKISDFALSFAAFGAAFVVATKELILCFLGNILRIDARVSIGDRLEIGTVHGDIVDMTLLTTSLMEVSDLGIYTGKLISIPNSDFISKQIATRSHIGLFEIKTTSIKLFADENLPVKKDLFTKVVADHCAPYLSQAAEDFKRTEKNRFYDMPNAEPRIILQMTGKDEATVIARYPAPFGKGWQAEQEILDTYLKAASSIKSSHTNNIR